jgi:hypothetical protein
LLSIAEFAFGWDLGIDQLLFTESVQEAVGSVRPGLMSPVTAVNFILLGFALTFLDCKAKGKAWLAQTLCLAAGLASLFTLLDFTLKPHAFHTHIALQTVTAFCIFSFAPVCARPERGLSALMASSQSHSIWGRLVAPAEETWLRFWPLRVGVAIVSVVAAALLRRMSGGFIPEGLTYTTFYPAVMLSAMLGGLWPGVVATLLCLACADYYFLQPVEQFGGKNASDLTGLLLFAIVGLGLACCRACWSAHARARLTT